MQPQPRSCDHKHNTVDHKQQQYLFVDPVELVRRIHEHSVGELLSLVEVGHVDVHFAVRHVGGDAVGVQGFERDAGVAHEQGAPGHVGSNVGVGMSLRGQLVSRLTDDTNSLSGVCCVSTRS